MNNALANKSKKDINAHDDFHYLATTSVGHWCIKWCSNLDFFVLSVTLFLAYYSIIALEQDD